MSSALNMRLKGWPGWIVLAVVTVSLLVVGATRSSGPQTPEDRVDAITQRLACPVCDGESVFESQNNASRAIRQEVAELVRASQLSDDEILAVFESRNSEILLVPKATGFEALVWVLPAVGFVIGVVALAVTFRRWRRESEGIPDPTDEDRALVAAALAGEPVPDDDVDDQGADVAIEEGTGGRAAD